MYIEYHKGQYEIREGDLILASFDTYEEADAYIERNEPKK